MQATVGYPPHDGNRGLSANAAQIKYANHHSIPFLAFSGGHGAILSLKKMNGGIGISMRNMKKININRDGKSAVLGGGHTVGEARSGLYFARKYSRILFRPTTNRLTFG